MYIRCPDYGDFQCYDSGREDALNKVARKIYANFHNPSWQTLKHRLLSVKIPKKLVRGRSVRLMEMVKKAISNKNECLADYLKSQLQSRLMS